MPINKEKIADLLIKIFPYDNGEDYDITFQIANNTFSPFQKVDYLINGIFEDVRLMNVINSNDLKDEKQIKNRKERIYTNGKIIHPIYKIKKSNNEESDANEERDVDDKERDVDDKERDVDDEEVDDKSDESEEVYDDDVESISTRRSKRGGGNKKNKKQHRKTKKHSKK